MADEFNSKEKIKNYNYTNYDPVHHIWNSQKILTFNKKSKAKNYLDTRIKNSQDYVIKDIDELNIPEYSKVEID